MRYFFNSLPILALLLLTISNAHSTDNGLNKQQCFFNANDAYLFLVNQDKQTKNSVININTASQAELLSLQGVGVKTAEAIVFYRQTMGRFNSVDDLLKVKGIGQKTLDKNRHRLVVQ